MYLLDTNVWLELLLDQDRAEDVQLFLEKISPERIFMTEFSLHSIGIIMSRFDKMAEFELFVQEVLIDGGVSLISLRPEDVQYLVSTQQKFKLDYDDAYQYVGAERYSLTIISFDRDFKKTENGYKMPHEITMYLK